MLPIMQFPKVHQSSSCFWPGVIGAILACTAFGSLYCWSGRHEWFFPELLALFMGCTWMKACPWKTSRWKLFFSLAAGSMIGYGLSFCSSLSLICQLGIAYVLASLWMLLQRVNVSPMFSACMLPLYLGKCSVLYPLAIVLQVALLCVLTDMAERINLHDREIYEPTPPFAWHRLRSIALKAALLMPTIFLARQLIGPYAAVPPLIVVFSVFCDMKRPAAHHVLLGIGFCLLASLCGCGGRLAADALGIPFVTVLPLLVFVLALTGRVSSFYLPPCGAAMLLPFLIPHDGVTSYCWQMPIGAIIFIAAAKGISWVMSTMPKD